MDDNDTEPTFMTDDPQAERLHAERREMTRMCAQRIIDHHEHGRRMAEEETLQWARDFVAMNPRYPLPLTTGEPA